MKKKMVLFIFIGIIICGVIGIKAATTIQSSQVLYKDKTLDTALNEIYDDLYAGKEKLATAITSNGVETTSESTFEEMTTNVNLLAQNKYNEGYSAGQSSNELKTGNARSGSVVAGVFAKYSISVTISELTTISYINKIIIYVGNTTSTRNDQGVSSWTISGNTITFNLVNSIQDTPTVSLYVEAVGY